MDKRNTFSSRRRRDLLRLPPADVVELIGEFCVAEGQSVTPSQLRRWEADWRAWCSFCARMGFAAVPIGAKCVRQFLLEAIISGAKKPRLGQYLKSFDYFHNVAGVKKQWPANQNGRILDELFDRHLATPTERPPSNPAMIKAKPEKAPVLRIPPLKTTEAAPKLAREPLIPRRVVQQAAAVTIRPLPADPPISTRDAPWLSPADREEYIRIQGRWLDGAQLTWTEWFRYVDLGETVIAGARNEFERGGAALKKLLLSGRRLIYGQRLRQREFAVDLICGAIQGAGGYRSFAKRSGGSVLFQDLENELVFGQYPSDERTFLARRCIEVLRSLYTSASY